MSRVFSCPYVFAFFFFLLLLLQQNTQDLAMYKEKKFILDHGPGGQALLGPGTMRTHAASAHGSKQEDKQRCAGDRAGPGLLNTHLLNVTDPVTLERCQPTRHRYFGHQI